MSLPRVYISGPLTDGDSLDGDVRLANVNRAIDAFAELAESAFSPLCPHLTEYVERRHPLRIPYGKWIELDLPWIDVSDAVLRLPGPSKGADREVEYAFEHSVPVFHNIADLVEHFREVPA